MKKAITIALALLVVGIAAVVAMAATKPDEFQVERSQLINTTPEKIFPHINNYRNWTAWSPWEKVDPAMKRSYSGPESGVGARYAWVGNGDVGEGDMEIIESSPAKIEINLHFIKPFEGKNKAIFSLNPEGEATRVTWAMTGDSPFMCKVMQVFINMDDCCGREFEKGLASLKTVSERSETANTQQAL